VISHEYRTNRARFPRAELDKYRGNWVAFSADGLRVVAGGPTVDDVEEQLTALGIDAQRVVLEWVPGPDDDSQLAGGQWL
jgi:hypothetical protein